MGRPLLLPPSTGLGGAHVAAASGSLLPSAAFLPPAARSLGGGGGRRSPVGGYRTVSNDAPAIVAMKALAGPSEFMIASSSAAADPAAAAAGATAAATVFEPVLPDSTALLGMGSVVVLSIIAGYVWSNSVVPVSRTKLAISKSRGEVKDYLDGLREEEQSSSESGASEGGESTVGALNSTALSQDDSSAPANSQLVEPNVGGDDGRGLERWLFSDWLNSRANAKAGRQKEPALPVLKDAKWNSGDNPVLVTAALLGLCVLLASVTERVGSVVGSVGSV